MKNSSRIPTIRQIEALSLRCAGKSFEEMARIMGLSEPTVCQHSREGAIKLMRWGAKPSMEELAEKARIAYPRIAARYPKKTKETA